MACWPSRAKSKAGLRPALQNLAVNAARRGHRSAMIPQAFPLQLREERNSCRIAAAAARVAPARLLIPRTA